MALAGWGLVAVCAFLAAVSAWQFTDQRGHPIDDLLAMIRGAPAAGRDGAPETTASIGGGEATDADGRAMRVVLAGPAAGTPTDVEGLRREVLALKALIDMLSRTNADLARRVAMLEDARLVTGSIPTTTATPMPVAASPRALATTGPAGVPPLSATDPLTRRAPAAPTPAAALPAPPEAAVPSGTDAPVTRTDFALDLGAKANLSILRGHWTVLARTHSQIIGPLTPLVQVREGADGKTSTHLIAGPFANAVLAAAACERLKTAGTPCEPTLFSGQGLTLR